jgi:NOL1/NOP2/fmu family ribosome biogenesis protein
MDLEPEGAQIEAYMSGNVIPGDKKGWCLVTVGGYSIGWGKGDGQQLKNHYPKGLRRLG